jgi:acyl carrier protein
MLINHLRKALSAVLKTSISRIDPGRPMGSMGVDSLMALEFVRRLSKETGAKLPATVVFNYPTLESLGAELIRRLNLDGAVPEAKVDAALTIPEISVVDVSEEDALRALCGEGTRL